MRTTLKFIDAISTWTAKIARWLALVLVALVSLEVIMRYFFNMPTMWNFETSMMVGASLMAMGWAYAHLHHCHIRIDVIYSRLSPRSRAGIDVIGTSLIFFPLIIVFVSTSFAWMLSAWVTGERSVQTYWYPPMAPFRAVVLLGFVLLALQGIAQFVRDLYLLIKNKAYD